jgi:hypothetical protein
MATSSKKSITLTYKCLHESEVKVSPNRIELERQYAAIARCPDCAKGNRSIVIDGNTRYVGEVILCKPIKPSTPWIEGTITGVDTKASGWIGVKYFDGFRMTATHLDSNDDTRVKVIK